MYSISNKNKLLTHQERLIIETGIRIKHLIDLSFYNLLCFNLRIHTLFKYFYKLCMTGIYLIITIILN